MKLLSFSEYEFGVLAIGGTPTGIIALGLMPVGVVAIGTVPIGVISVACGAGLGLANFTCGIGVGAYVRCTGLALGGDAKAVGLQLGLAGEWPPSGSKAWYWARVAIVALAVLGVLGYVGNLRLGLTKMNRVVEATWTAHPETVEGMYIAPETECQVWSEMRSDGEIRLHANILVTCGSLELAYRNVRKGCDVRQRRADGGHVYDLACEAEHVAESSDEDSHTPEQPGVLLDTIADPGRVRIRADGPPPMHVVLAVDSPSQRVEGEPLLTDRRTRLDEEPGEHAGR